jgi:hypothetical protein
MADLQLVGGDRQQDQAVLHDGRFYRLPKESTTRTLAMIQNNWYDVIGNTN